MLVSDSSIDTAIYLLRDTFINKCLECQNPRGISDAILHNSSEANRPIPVRNRYDPYESVDGRRAMSKRRWLRRFAVRVKTKSRTAG